MSKNKKLLSVLLAMIMALSVMSAGFVAAAKSAPTSVPFTTKDTAVLAVEDKINAYSGDMNTAAPTDEDKAGYDALIQAFTDLSDVQKDSIDPFALDKLTQLVYKYELALSGKTTTAARKDAAAKVLETLNSPALNAAQQAIDDGLLSTSTATETMLSLYKELNGLSKLFAGTAYSSYGMFYYALSSDSTYVQNAFYTVVNKVWGDLKKAEPYSGKTPNYKDYPDGKTDPAYIADYRQYYAEKYTFETKQLKDAITQVANTCDIPQYADIVTYLDKAAAAMDTFYATKDYKQAVEANAYYQTLDADVQLAVKGLRMIAYFTFVNVAETKTAPTTVQAAKFPGTVADMAEYEKIVAFEKFVANINEPYVLETAKQARAMYDALPESLLSELSEDSVAKIRALSYFAATHDPSTEKPDVSDYHKTKVTYPDGVTHDQTLEAIPKMDTLVNEVVKQVAGNDLNSLVKNGLYTNEMIGTLVKAICPLLAGFGMDGDFAPSGYLARIATQDDNGNWVAKNPAYKGAVAALAKVAANTNNWDDVVFENGDWFKDGDKQGFCEAAANVFTMLMNLTTMGGWVNVGDILFQAIQFENVYDFNSNTLRIGSYENIVHIFEAIGIECMDSVAYSDAVNAKTDVDEKIVARFVPILDALCTFVEKFAAYPVSTLTEILPNVAYALNTGIIDANIKEILGRLEPVLSLAGITLPNLDFTAEGLFNTLGDLGIDGITFEEQTNSAGEPVYPNQGILHVRITLVEEEKAASGAVITPAQYTTLSIKETDFLAFLNKVEGCGTMTVADSICVDNAYRPYIVSDKADTFVTTVRFIYDDVLMTNKDSVKDIVNVANPTVGSILGPVLDVMANYLPADAAIVALVNVANPYEPTLPDVNLPTEGSSIRDLLNKILSYIGDKIQGVFNPDSDGGNDTGDGQSQTGNPSIPKTGGQIMTTLFALAATAAFAGGAILYKKKAEEE